jgi:hypothetical protein
VGEFWPLIPSAVSQGTAIDDGLPAASKDISIPGGMLQALEDADAPSGPCFRLDFVDSQFMSDPNDEGLLFPDPDVQERRI